MNKDNIVAPDHQRLETYEDPEGDAEGQITDADAGVTNTEGVMMSQVEKNYLHTDGPVQDGTSHDIKAEGDGKVSRKIICYLILFFILVAGAAVGVIYAVENYLVEDSVKLDDATSQAATEESQTPIEYSWTTCGAKTMLDVEISEKFEAPDACTNVSQDPIMIMGYNADSFYSGNL